MQDCHAIYIFVKQILSLRFSKFCGCHFMLDIFCRVWYNESDSIKAIPHKDCATDASSNFSSDETKSEVNT